MVKGLALFLIKLAVVVLLVSWFGLYVTRAFVEEMDKLHEATVGSGCSKPNPPSWLKC